MAFPEHINSQPLKEWQDKTQKISFDLAISLVLIECDAIITVVGGLCINRPVIRMS